MSEKFLTRLLSFIICAGLVLSPVTAYAGEAALEEGEDQVLIEDAKEEEAAEEIVVEENELDVTDIYENEEDEDEEAPATADAEADAQLQDELPPFYAWINGNKLYWQKVDGAAMYRIEVDGITFGVYYSPTDLDAEFSAHYVNSGYHTFKFYAANDWRLPITRTVTLSYNYTTSKTYIREVTATSDVDKLYTVGKRDTVHYSNISHPGVRIEFVGWYDVNRYNGDFETYEEDDFYPADWVEKVKVYLDPEYTKQRYELIPYPNLSINERNFTLTGKETKDGITYYNFDAPKYTYYPVRIKNARVEGDYLYFDPVAGAESYLVEIGTTKRYVRGDSSPINLEAGFTRQHIDSGEYDIILTGRKGFYDVPWSQRAHLKFTYVKRKQPVSESWIESNASDIIGYNKPLADPEFEDSKSYLDAAFGGWQEKTEDPQEEWTSCDKERFKKGTYRYLVKVRIKPKYDEDYTLDENLKLNVGKTVFTKIEGGDEFVFASPEFEVDYPELTNVKFEGDVLSWDPVDDEDLWFYQINVGKYQKITSECSVDLKEICDASGYYGGIIPIELFAIAYEYKPITQVYSFDYEYDGPLPKDRTVISELTLQSSIKGMFREGYPNSNMLSAGDQFWIDCLEGWWEIYEDDEWSRYNEPTFGKGTYRYKNKISIDADYKDSYMLDPKLTLTVDKKEWFRCETEYDINDEVIYIVFVSPEYVLPLPEKAKITAISASCEDPSGYVIKDAEQALPELTNIDREEVDIKTAWVLYENGEPKQPEGNTFTPGEWHLAIAVLVKEDYEDIYELERTTTLTINGEEWTNVTGKGDPHYGVFFVSPGYVIEDDEPVEVTGTWHSRWGTTYFETEEGEKITGLQTIEGEIYYFNSKGVLQKSTFYEEDGKKYYFGSDGKAVKGWLDKWAADYYFDENGIMQTGFVEIDENIYYFNAKGHLIKSAWIEEEGKKYYAKSDGKLAKSESIKKWGKKYSFDENGVLLP